MRQSTGRLASRKDESGRGEKKRKLGSEQTATSTAAAAPISSGSSAQQSISQLFSQTAPSEDTTAVKRPKVGGSASPDVSRQGPPQTMTTLTSPRAERSFIDLSSSREPTPFARRSNPPRPYKSSFNPHAGAQRIKVKNLRIGYTNDSQQYFVTVWAQLRALISLVFQGGDVPSFEDSYRSVQHLCMQGHGEELSMKLDRELQTHASRLGQELAEARVDNVVDRLRAVITAWSRWQACVVCGLSYSCG